MLSNDDYCHECGNEHLREATDEDYCFLLECRQAFGEMLKDGLGDEDLECVLLPWGNGVRTGMGLELENYRVYVRYKNIERAVEILKDFIGEPEIEKLRKKLLENVDNWYIAKESTAKKITKKLKADKSENIFDIIEKGVRESDSIRDRGLMGVFIPEAHGIAVKIGDVILWFSDETFEIQI